MRSLALGPILLPVTITAQMLTPTMLTTLDPGVSETSGLIVVNDEVWTHQDGGNPNEIYRIDPVNGTILRTVVVANAGNVDWEEMTTSNGWLYLADVGNNSGARTNLRVYRVDLNEVLDPGTVSVMADTIRFVYDLQTDFTPAQNNNDWDCEALIAVDDTLYLFSKNWVSGNCYRYALPAMPGDHVAQRIDTFDTQGMVTGATYDPISGDIGLIGYTSGFLPFAWRLSNYPGTSFFSGNSVRYGIPLPLTQFEAIAWHAPGVALLTNEQTFLGPARLWELSYGLVTATPQISPDAMQVWPVPNDGTFNIRVETATFLEVHDLQGRRVWAQQLGIGVNVVRMEGLASGVYVLLTDGSIAVQRIVVHC